MEIVEHPVVQARTRLGEIVNDVAVRKKRHLIRRRAELAALIVPVEDFRRIEATSTRAKGAPHEKGSVQKVESISSIRDSRDRLPDILDKITLENRRYLVERRGVPLAALLPVEDLKDIDPAAWSDLIQTTTASKGSAVWAGSTVVAMPEPALSPPDSVIRIGSSNLVDQNKQECFTEAAVFLEQRGGRKFLHGSFVLAPRVKRDKIELRVGDKIIEGFSRVTNQDNAYVLSPVEVHANATEADVKVRRLA